MFGTAFGRTSPAPTTHGPATRSFRTNDAVAADSVYPEAFSTATCQIWGSMRSTTSSDIFLMLKVMSGNTLSN